MSTTKGTSESPPEVPTKSPVVPSSQRKRSVMTYSSQSACLVPSVWKLSSWFSDSPPPLFSLSTNTLPFRTSPTRRFANWSGSVLITNKGTDGYVIIDALQVLPLKSSSSAVWKTRKTIGTCLPRLSKANHKENSWKCNLSPAATIPDGRPTSPRQPASIRENA